MRLYIAERNVTGPRATVSVETLTNPLPESDSEENHLQEGLAEYETMCVHGRRCFKVTICTLGHYVS